MGAIFWERGFDFDNPTLDQLIETKIMTDGITQIYAMTENFQIALNEVIAFLAGQAKGQPKTLSPEVQELLDLHPGQAAQPGTQAESDAESQPDADLAAALEPEPMPGLEPELPPEPEAETELPEEPRLESLPEEAAPQPEVPAESPAGPEEVIPESVPGDTPDWDMGLPPEMPAASSAPAPEPEVTEPVPEEPAEPEPTAEETVSAMVSESAVPDETPDFEGFGESAPTGESLESPSLPSDFPSEASLDSLLESESVPAAEPAPPADNVLAFEAPPSGEESVTPPPAAAVPEPAPKKRRGRKKKAVAATTAEVKPKEKKKRGRKPKILAPGEEKPKRRKPRQKRLKIDLSAVQVPDDFMMDEEEAVTSRAPEPATLPEEQLPREETQTEEPAAPACEPPETAEVTEVASDSQLLSEMASDWEPEAIAHLPIANEPEEPEPPSVSPEVETWEPAAAVESTETAVEEPSEVSVQAEEPAVELQEEDKLGFDSELGAKPEPEPGPDSESLAIEPEPALEPEPEAQFKPEQEAAPVTGEEPEAAESSPSSWTELGGSEMEPSEYTDTAGAQPAEDQTGYSEDVQEPQMAEPPKRKGGGLAAFFMLLLGLALGGGGSYYWFGIQEAQHAKNEIASLQQQLDEANENLATARTELAEAQDQAKQLSELFDQQHEAALQPVAKPKYVKAGRGVVIYWLDKEVNRKYNLYRAKGTKAKLKKMNEKPMSSNVVVLKKVSRGTWRYAVAGIDLDGEEAELSETLKIRFY